MDEELETPGIATGHQERIPSEVDSEAGIAQNHIIVHIPRTGPPRFESDLCVSIHYIESFVKRELISSWQATEATSDTIVPITWLCVGWSPIFEIVMRVNDRIDYSGVRTQVVMVLNIAVYVIMVRVSWLPLLAKDIVQVFAPIFLIVLIVDRTDRNMTYSLSPFAQLNRPLVRQ